ncbi:MAG TPA: hypothetical protein VFI54_14300 [Solirubrobacteraceae bacterium]|nr:hypothetical protein [Solirubrobacteraceae bacterium]
MKHSCHFSWGLIRTLVLTAVTSAAALLLVGFTSASGGINYENSDPLTGRPAVSDVSVNYGDFNPLTGRPDSAPQPTSPSSRTVRVGGSPELAAPSVRTVVKDHGGHVLAISLAAGAILIALASAGYTVVRASTARARSYGA